MNRTSCLPGRGNKLCQVCGPSIDTEDVEFSRRESNLVYMDKVFSYNEATSCPILQTLNTANTNFTTELIFKNPIDNNCGCGNDNCGCGCGNDNCGCGCGNDNCGCGCGNAGRVNCQNCFFCGNCTAGANTCTLDANAVFTINRSYVLVESFTLSNSGSLTANDVTADGIPVDSLTFAGGQFSAATNNLIPQISKDRCLDLGLPTKAFVLVAGAGPWSVRATYVLEGTVNTGGKTCCFQAKFRNTDTAPTTVNGTTTFALPKVSFPCIISGMAPTVNFRFSGRINMLNPEINVTCAGGNCAISLSTMLAVEPKINLEVVRRTLFCIEACEGMLPCDGTEAAYETAADEDCEWPPAPVCKCGTAPTPSNDAELCDSATVCNFEDDKNCCCNRPGGYGNTCAGNSNPVYGQNNGCNCMSGW